MFREDFELLQMEGFFGLDDDTATHVFFSLFKHFALFVVQPIGNLRMHVDLDDLGVFIIALPLKLAENLITNGRFGFNEPLAVAVGTRFAIKVQRQRGFPAYVCASFRLNPTVTYSTRLFWRGLLTVPL